MREHVADLPLALLRRATRSTRHLFRRAIQEDANRAIQEDASMVRASVVAIGWAMSATCSLVAGHGALYTEDCSGALHTDAKYAVFHAILPIPIARFSERTGRLSILDDL